MQKENKDFDNLDSPDDYREKEILMHNMAVSAYEELQNYYGKGQLLAILEKDTDIGLNTIRQWCGNRRAQWPFNQDIRKKINEELTRLLQSARSGPKRATAAGETAKPTQTLEGYGRKLAAYFGTGLFTQDSIKADNGFMTALIDKKIVEPEKILKGVRMYKIRTDYLTKLRLEQEDKQQLVKKKDK